MWHVSVPSIPPHATRSVAVYWTLYAPIAGSPLAPSKKWTGGVVFSGSFQPELLTHDRIRTVLLDG
jgi:hypothetical protein